jgi:hypothetical protein
VDKVAVAAGVVAEKAAAGTGNTAGSNMIDDASLPRARRRCFVYTSA